MATITELFDQAVGCQQRGDWLQAERLYRQMIDAQRAHLAPADPEHATVYNNLGIVLAMQGKFTEACASFREALRVDPGHAGALNNLGNALQDSGQSATAVECFRRAVQINPQLANAHNNLGNALVSLGQLPQASACFQQALNINPKHLDARNNLGLAFIVQNQLPEATSCFREVLAIDPNHAHACVNLGNALLLQKQPAEAAECFRRAIGFLPNYANAHNNLGQALDQLGQTTLAIESFRQAIQLEPNNANAHNNLGNALVAQGDLAGATESYKQALRISPGDANARENLANAFTNLGNALKDQGPLNQAAENYRQALTIDAQHTMARWNQALLHLLQGDFEGGWPDYELRWDMPEKVKRFFSQPRWDGRQLDGKTILVYAEQALGDTIQFARYLPLVKERGGTVLFECQPALKKLMNLACVDGLLAAGDPLPSFDCQIPLVSIPGVLGTTLATIPAHVPYVEVDAESIRRAALRKPAGSRIQIGIVWQGSMAQKGDRRSVPLSLFEPLKQVTEVDWFSLQVGPGAEQLAKAPFPITDLGRSFDPNSLEDLAGAISNLDLIITVDTAAAHLAGALAVPVWTLLPYVPDWRWLMHRQDSPWYPTMRLFRQKKFGHWSGVFEDLAAAIKMFSPGSKNRG
jgi:tetratricopeptide (TPR) repeat protein